MKKNTITLFFGGLTVIGLAVLTNCTSGSDDKGETTGYTTASTSPESLCLVKPSWFPHSQTPAPKEGKGSPFDTSSSTNQIFHQWSWNKFLWLTKPDQGGNPLFLNQSEVKQVTSHMATITLPTGASVVLQDTAQAGPNSSILQTNPDYNSSRISETVYYSIHMNPIMYSAGLKFASRLKNGTLPATNEASFPVGSFELKVAWVPLSAIPTAKQSAYFTTTASLSTNNGVSFTNTKVALIGMHVVGVVQNHPEFIWATFEHDDLSPDYDWKKNSASSDLDQLLFKKGNVTGINGIVYNTSTMLGQTPNQVFDLFQYGIPRNSDGSFMATSQQEPADFKNVDGINQCVKSHLKDVWANYFYNGSIWLNTDGKTPLQQAQLIDSLAGNIGNASPGSYARGSLNCANVTMETFTQTFESNISGINVGNLANCFSCHSAQSFTGSNVSPIYLSHVFQDYLLDQQGNTFKKTEAIKSGAEQRLMKIMQKK
jgi:hypothetical protein